MKKWRINLIFILIIVFGAAIIGRLFDIQIIQHDFHKALAQGQQSVYELAKGDRGEIFFRGGQVLATNVREKYVFISPEEIEEKERTAERLSQILGLEKELILEKTRKDNLFEEIKLDLTEKEKEDLEEADLKGVHLSEKVERSYPQKFMASVMIGFLGGEETGQYGIEGYFDDILQGREYIDDREDIKGKDNFLTLDYNIQFTIEKLLEKAKKDLDIEGGQIIVINPNSGEILALANFPNFDPNRYWEVDNFRIFQNPAIQELFEPGSVFKPITMAGALDQGKITPLTSYIDRGEVKVGGWTIYNYNKRIYGEQTMTQVLEKSINTGAVFVEKQLGHELFLDYIDRFGFFELTGIDLQEEIFSENQEFKKGYEINFVNASFGQGIEITPIQLVRAFSVIANGGKLVKPYVVKKIYKDNQFIENKAEISKDKIISPKTASQITAMMVSVIENGFSKGARIPGYYLAGKTGTAQVSWSALGVNRKGYSDKTWQSFIGFGPAFDPKFLILVKLDNPEAKTAEYSAAPIFKELAKYLIDYLEIPPDYE